jgi:hypothetical protein
MRTERSILLRLTVVTAYVLLGCVTAAAQTRTTDPARTGAPGAGAYAPPLTPWGHPDLQGIWTSDDARPVPLQRPPEFGTRQWLTDDEFAARRARDDETRADTREGAGTFVGEVGTRTLRQTSLVVDPPDGRVPPRTPAADQRIAALAAAASHPLLPASWHDRSLFERCITRGALNALPTIYGNGLRIVQGPDTVAISYEMVHETRLVPIGGGPRPGGQPRAYMGLSRGRWEGGTLIVESTNFTDRTAIAGTRHTEQLHLVERFTRVAEDTIQYEVTVTDPNTWSAPFRILLPLTTQPGYRIFPFECHEGNMALRNILAGARVEEQVREEYVRKGLEPPPLARPGDGEILPPDPSFGRRR